MGNTPSKPSPSPLPQYSRTVPCCECGAPHISTRAPTDGLVRRNVLFKCQGCRAAAAAKKQDSRVLRERTRNARWQVRDARDRAELERRREWDRTRRREEGEKAEEERRRGEYESLMREDQGGKRAQLVAKREREREEALRMRRVEDARERMAGKEPAGESYQARAGEKEETEKDLREKQKRKHLYELRRRQLADERRHGIGGTADNGDKAHYELEVARNAVDKHTMKLIEDVKREGGDMRSDIEKLRDEQKKWAERIIKREEQSRTRDVAINEKNVADVGKPVDGLGK